MAVVYMPQGGSVNKKQVEGIIKEIVNLEDYAKTSDVPTKLSELTNDKDFATVNRVLEEIAKSQLEGSEVNLSAYATKEFVADEIEKIDVTEQLGEMFSFDSDGNLVVSINGVTKKFVPVDNYDNAQVIDDTELSDIMGDIPYDN